MTLTTTTTSKGNRKAVGLVSPLMIAGLLLVASPAEAADNPNNQPVGNIFSSAEPFGGMVTINTPRGTADPRTIEGSFASAQPFGGMVAIDNSPSINKPTSGTQSNNNTTTKPLRAPTNATPTKATAGTKSQSTQTMTPGTKTNQTTQAMTPAKPAEPEATPTFGSRMRCLMLWFLGRSC